MLSSCTGFSPPVVQTQASTQIKRIDNLHSTLHKVSDVASSNRKALRSGNRRDLPILNAERAADGSASSHHHAVVPGSLFIKNHNAPCEGFGDHPIKALFQV